MFRTKFCSIYLKWTCKLLIPACQIKEILISTDEKGIRLWKNFTLIFSIENKNTERIKLLQLSEDEKYIFFFCHGNWNLWEIKENQNSETYIEEKLSNIHQNIEFSIEAIASLLILMDFLNFVMKYFQVTRVLNRKLSSQ